MSFHCGGKPFNPHLTLNNAVSNVICLLVFGHRFEYSDERFVKLMKMFDEALQIEGSIWAQVPNFNATDGLFFDSLSFL